MEYQLELLKCWKNNNDDVKSWKDIHLMSDIYFFFLWTFQILFVSYGVVIFSTYLGILFSTFELLFNPFYMFLSFLLNVVKQIKWRAGETGNYRHLTDVDDNNNFLKNKNCLNHNLKGMFTHRASQEQSTNTFFMNLNCEISIDHSFKIICTII